MKKIFIVTYLLIFALVVKAQEFTTQLTTAKSAYSSGKLDDSRFAMQQMLQEIDMVVGKEVLKLFPAKMEDITSNASKDNVSGTSGFMGVMIHRDYGTDDKNISLEIICNSPMIASLNTLLSLPFIGNTGDNKVVKISGYKALIQRSTGEKENTFNYDMQLPLKSSLITLKAPGFSQEQLIRMANTLPIDKIAKMLE